ncbi:MAG: A/G-specific adenine glycosylase [Deltaproteobacteria bacterium]|nr:MAG: A/G-specific adenine glycosylase [Deltaproteobacteria bacterium]
MNVYKEKSSMKKQAKLSSQEIHQFKKKIYDHYKKHGRILPWRRTENPYQILVSEIMLQQTQVVRVIEKYEQFIHTFPDIESVARAPLRDILKVWQGLGYNRRALALKKLAQIIVDHYDGTIPSTMEALKALPGIGSATAGAICAFAFNQPAVFIETNIRSVFIDHFFRNRHDVKDIEILPLIEKTLDTKNPRIWYYALMDYGVALKERHDSVNRRSAHYTKQSPFEGSNRQIRGMILKALVSKPVISETALLKKINLHDEMVKQSLRQLCDEGLIMKKGKYITIG